MENKGQPDYKQQRERLIAQRISEGLLRTPRVIEGIKRVPRELFVPENLRPYAYNDAPLPTDQGQTISAPHVPKKGRARHGRNNERGSGIDAGTESVGDRRRHRIPCGDDRRDYRTGGSRSRRGKRRKASEVCARELASRTLLS